MKNQCLECKSAFTGRSDKKFCSDYCRNSFNNRRNSQSNNYIRRVNYVLKKNRKILASYYSPDDCVINRNKLLMDGYNFNFFTSYQKTNDGKTYYFCYDFGFQVVKNNLLSVISLKKQDEINMNIEQCLRAIL
jgi:hypothetical protein